MKKIISIPLKILGWLVSILLAIVLLVFVGEKFVYGSFFFGGAKIEMAIPGLWSSYVPQGFDRIDDDTYLMSAYDKGEELPSVIFVMDDDKSTKCELYAADGTPYMSHAGGVTHFNNYVYIANDTGDYENFTTTCDMFLLSDVTDGDGKATMIDSIEIPNRLAYCSVYEGKLYTGAFYREGSKYVTPESHQLQTPAGDQNTALMMVYTLGEDGKPVSSTPDRIYSTLSNVQGMCLTDSGKIVLSTSWGLSTSQLYVHDETKAAKGTFDFNGTDVELIYLDSASLTQTVACPPMAEELVNQNGRVYILTESASMKYIFGKIMSGNFVHSFPIA